MSSVISPDGREDSATIHQDAEIYRIRLQPGETIQHQLRSGRGLWLQIMRGSLTLDGEALIAGDGASSEDEGDFEIRAIEATEALLFDLK